MADDTSRDGGDKVTEMMLDALRLLAVNRVAPIRRHPDAGEIAVRTAASLVNRGWGRRASGGEKVTLLELTFDGRAAAAEHGITVGAAGNPGDEPQLTAAQAEHVNRALRYLGEAMTALQWAQLPSPNLNSARHPWVSQLSDGERLVGEASNALIDGLEALRAAAPPDPLDANGTRYPGQPGVGGA
ncbi:MAG: hypothetical protein J0J04_07995 [Microbacterium sp.]|uniref:hypothetical protein n=1 Tax=Microbacterium sp. TaxID=51671 RepID=UPI001ACB715D|nr:hypothetical protein [Microbacterium sp.]MBN9214741.1 hypothetical protein [Microbacterium sp.]